MSLPREIREELLSAYLDDALSGDERKRVEQIIASDEEARSLLERMRSIQASTKAAMRSHQRPADGLSGRVIAAAIDRAEQESLPAEHHVRLAASRAGETKPASLGRFQQHYGPLALALAATLLLAVTLWNFFPGQDGADGIASVPQDEETNGKPAVASTDIPSSGTTADPVEGSEGGAETAPAVGSVADAEGMPANISGEESSDIAPAERATPEALATGERDSQPMESEQPASDDGAEPLSPTPETDRPIDDPAAMLATQAVMMFEVEQTEVGRENNAVLEAMRKAGIEAETKQRANDALVGYLQEAHLVADPSETSDDADAASQVSVVYVEASGKELDRFMLSLFGNTEEIARIGWNLAMDAPVVEAATQIEKVIATDVRHAEDSATAWQLVAGDAEQGFRASGSGREFLPIDRTDPAGWQAVGSASSGADIRSRLLILIR